MGFESRLKQKEDLTTELARVASFSRGDCYYNQQSYFLFEPKSKSYDRNGGVINSWISTGIHNDSKDTDLFSVKNLPPSSSSFPSSLPKLINQNNILGILFQGSYRKQTKVGYAHGSGLNIYIVYKLNDLNNSDDSKIRNTVNPTFTAQNCLFGAVKITPDAGDSSKYKYSGYGISFDAKGKSSFGNRRDARNVIISGVDMTPYYPSDSSSLSSQEKYISDNKIYVFGQNFIQDFSADGGGHTIKKNCTKLI